jgi:hypothetical protein
MNNVSKDNRRLKEIDLVTLQEDHVVGTRKLSPDAGPHSNLKGRQHGAFIELS